MPDAYTDLELELRFLREEKNDHVHRRTYLVEMTCTPARSQASYDPLNDARPEATLDLLLLDEHRHNFDWTAYGMALGEMLMAEPDTRGGWKSAVQSAGQGQMRVRLTMDWRDADLQRIVWEALRLPDMAGWLATHKRFYLYRHLSSGDARPVVTSTRPATSAVVAVASPTLPQLDEINGDAELAYATSGLKNVPITPLVGPGKATLKSIETELNKGCDILYLVCHGKIVDDEPYLFLVDPANGQDRVAAHDLIERLEQLEAAPPTLIVLISCQSSGDGTSNALQALGPRLVACGIPAVLAMQGNFTMDSAALFVPAFLGALQSDGRIDRAVAYGRGEIRNRDDVWMPVLFTRLNQGRLWQIDRATIEVPDAVAAQRQLLDQLKENRARDQQRREELQTKLTEVMAPPRTPERLAQSQQIFAETMDLDQTINGYNEQIKSLEQQLPPEAPVPAPRRGVVATRIFDFAGPRTSLWAANESMLFEALSTLDCHQQSETFGQMALARRPSVFLLVGDQQFRIRLGLQQLLLRLVRELSQLAPKPVEERSLLPPGGAILDTATAWDLLAEQLESTGLPMLERPRRLGKILGQQLQDKHVFFIVEQASNLPDLTDLIDGFWEPLIAEVTLAPMGGRLLLLILDDAARLAQTAPHPALQILQLVQYPRDHFDIWFKTKIDDLPGPLQKLRQPELDQLWQDSQNGVADLVLTHLCEPAQVDPKKLFALE